jgi:GH24 family phage-related lysozyme (muramidase)
MSLNVGGLSAQEYGSRLKAFIKSVEGQSLPVYLDTGGNPTIGWGFALNTDSNGRWRNEDALRKKGSSRLLAHVRAHPVSAY